ncbi:MAG: hypothetical protein CMP63_00955 [Flavobacteriales bacterium]|nr:hypothetical protein [Flavobacteriales bacterium]
MKNFFKSEISNWRLVLITLVFVSVLIIIMSDELGLTSQYIQYIYYLIYCFIVLSYLDVFWKKIKKRKPLNDILDD